MENEKPPDPEDQTGNAFREWAWVDSGPEAALAAGDDRGLAIGQPEIHYRPHAYQALIT
jgi:hypothetical protein